MSAPIHFKGTDYDSVEAMPPHIRRAYEQSQRDKARRQQSQAGEKDDEDEEGDKEDADGGDDKVEEQPRPAWGGPRPEGSVPVPKEFDAVTGLGPALEVHEAEPGIEIPYWGTPVAHAAVRYQDGLAYQAKGKEIHTLRWEEVAAIVTNNRFHPRYTQCEYTLVKASGEKLILDDWLKGVQRLAAYIEKPVYERLGPPLAQRYQAGEALTFGPVTVQRQAGCQLDGQPYAWEAIQDVKVENGRFKVTLRTGQKHEARVNVIPNIELLCQLIGVKLISSQLAYM
jgi:hypothetical protein